MGVTERIAEFVVETDFADIPSEAVRTAKDICLDALGVAMVGSAEPQGKIIIDHVREVGGIPEAVVVGGGFRTSAPNAALANGTLIHAIEYDDTWLPLGHPTCTVLPVVLALGEKLGLGGKSILAAFVLGLEVHGKVGFGYSTPSFHSTSVHGALAAGAAAAKLLGLDVEQTTMALGIAASGAGGLSANVGTMTKTLHAGQAARNGLVAAMLARDSFTANRDVIESFGRAFMGERYDPKSAISNLGNPFHIISPGVGIKTYPTCYLNHRPLDALFQIIREHDISFEDVESVEVEVPHERFLNNPKPQSGHQAQFSLQYNLAVALLDREVTIETFHDEKVRQLVKKGALDRVMLRVRPDIPADYAQSFQPVTVRLKDGRSFTHRVDRPKGHWENPLSHEEILTKYRANADRVLSARQRERSIQLVENLENLKDIRELANLVMTTAAG